MAVSSLDTVKTEVLETEFRELSEQLDLGKCRFNWVRDELSRRRQENKETGADQPEPKTAEQEQADALETARGSINTLTRKIIAMEAEQAKMVIEIEVAKWRAREAEERLALVAKYRDETIRAPLEPTRVPSGGKSKSS